MPLRSRKRCSRRLNGLVTLTPGLMVLNQWPSSAVWVIGAFVGIDLLFDGWAMIGLALAAGQAALPPPKEA